MPEVSLGQWNTIPPGSPQRPFSPDRRVGRAEIGVWVGVRHASSSMAWGPSPVSQAPPRPHCRRTFPRRQSPQILPALRFSFWGEVDATLQRPTRHPLQGGIRRVGLRTARAIPARGAAEPAATNPNRLSPHSVQPRRTIIVDLRPSEDVILERMKQKCRYNIRLAQRKGISVRIWDDVAAFHPMLETTGERNAFGVHSGAYYRRAYELFHPIGACELLVAQLW